MLIGPELANQLASQVTGVLGRDLLVADLHGQVMAGGVLVGKTIPEALAACQTNRPIESRTGGLNVRWEPFVYEGRVIGVFGLIETGRATTGETISLLQGLAEVLIHQHFVMGKLNSADALRADFIKLLLDDASMTNDQANQQADILKINIHFPQSVMLLHLAGFEDVGTEGLAPDSSEYRLAVMASAEVICAAIRSAFQNYQDNIIVYAHSNTFILLKGIGGESLSLSNTIRFLKERGKFVHDTLSKLHQGAVTIGIGQYYPDLSGLRKSYQDAILALNIGTKVWGAGRPYHIKDVGMFITLAHVGADRKTELAHQILSPLVADDQLFRTVQAFLGSNLNLTEAALGLHVHRNTLIYRLEKTKKLIGLDPRHFEDALQIKLGLMFYQS